MLAGDVPQEDAPGRATGTEDTNCLPQTVGETEGVVCPAHTSQ